MSFKFDQPPVVLIVDDDLGFVWWLGEILYDAGCVPVPALNCEEAVTVTSELSIEPDLIFLNPSLNGISDMIEGLMHRIKRPKLIDALPLYDKR